MPESYKHNIEQNRPKSKEHMLHDSVCMKYKIGQN